MSTPQAKSLYGGIRWDWGAHLPQPCSDSKNEPLPSKLLNLELDFDPSQDSFEDWTYQIFKAAKITSKHVEHYFILMTYGPDLKLN